MVYHVCNYIEMLFPRTAPGNFSWKQHGVHGRVFYAMKTELGIKEQTSLDIPISPKYAYLLDAMYLGYTNDIWPALTKHAEPLLAKPRGADIDSMVAAFVESAIKLGENYSLAPYRPVTANDMKFATEFLTKLVHELLNDHVRQLRNHDADLRKRVCNAIDNYNTKNGAFSSQTTDVESYLIDTCPNRVSDIIYRIPILFAITDDKLADIVTDYFSKK